MSRLLYLLLALAMLAGCPPVGSGDDDDSVSDDDDATAELPVLPDPGTADNDWGWNINDVCCGSPETAHPVGIVTMDPGYIQGVIDDELSFFYVFQSGPDLTTFTFPSFFEDVHLHEGDGLRFGDLIPPASNTKWDQTWNVTPDTVYAVEIIAEFSGFF